MRVLLGSLIVVSAFMIGEAVNCFYCASGNSSDIFQLANIYGGYELKSDALFQSTRIFDEDCGKNLKKYLKTIKCPYGCVFAEYIGHANFAGCARDGIILQSVSTYDFNEQHYRMATCGNNDCNESYETAKTNRVSPTESPTSKIPSLSSTTTQPILEASVTGSNLNNNSAEFITTDHPKSTKGKPNSALSVRGSTIVLLLSTVACLVF